eukprot:Hpha_TRINITY_DN16384_c3_g2::TRINITY_DN16384_c3_g2_i4::g.62949::m.62949
MGGCFKWSCLVRQGDSPDEARIKTLACPFALFIFLFDMFVIFRNLQSTNQIVTVIGYAITAVAALLLMGGVVSNAIPAGYLLDVLLVMCAVDMCLMDLGSATRSYDFRSWTFVVLALDCALIFKRYHMPLFII